MLYNKSFKNNFVLTTVYLTLSLFFCFSLNCLTSLTINSNNNNNNNQNFYTVNAFVVSPSSLHSNLNLTAFPDTARPAIYTSRKDFDAYRLYRGWKLARRLHIGAEKKWKIWIFKKFDFFESWSLKFHFSKLFQLSFEFVVTRRAGWSHPTSKSNTVSGKFWKTESATQR